MIKIFSLVLDLLKVCLCVKLELSVLQDLLCKSVKLDQSKLVQNWVCSSLPYLHSKLNSPHT